MRLVILVVCFSTLFINEMAAQSSAKDTSSYLFYEPPGLMPKVFAPGIISTSNLYEFGIAFSETADRVYYAVKLNDEWKAEIRYVELRNGRWSKSQKLELNDKYSYNDPYLSYDEHRLYFISNRPLGGEGETKDSDLWYIEKKENGWSRPIGVSEVVNTGKDEFYISLTRSGTLYFASNAHTSTEDKWDFDIYYAKSKKGEFQEPVRMGDSINSIDFECDAFVSPDESYMIFCSTRAGGQGEGDLYISFKNSANKWTKAMNMGEHINTKTHDFCPFVTQDGKYLFYTSNEDIYWVDATIIVDLREKYGQ